MTCPARQRISRLGPNLGQRQARKRGVKTRKHAPCPGRLPSSPPTPLPSAADRLFARSSSSPSHITATAKQLPGPQGPAVNRVSQSRVIRRGRHSLSPVDDRNALGRPCLHSVIPSCPAAGLAPFGDPCSRWPSSCLAGRARRALCGRSAAVHLVSQARDGLAS